MNDASSGAHGEGQSDYELTVSIPCDLRFTETVRELAVHAAKHAGCSDARAQAFGREVEEAARVHMGDVSGDAGLPLVFRRTTGPVEVLVNGRTLSAAP